MGRQLKPQTAFAARLIEARQPCERDEFAERLNVPKSTLANWERGDRFPPPEILERLPALTGVSLDWLITGKGPMRPESAAGTSWALPTIDAVLMGRLFEGVGNVYKEEGARIGPRDQGVVVARLYAELVSTYDTTEERLVALKLQLEQLRRDLRTPPVAVADSKRSA